MRNREAIEDLLAPIFESRTSQQVHLDLEAAGVPSEIPFDTHGGETVLHDEENLQLGLVVTYEHPLLGSLRQFGHLVTFSATPGRIAGPPPLVGEHSRDILAWAGYGPETVDELKAERRRGLAGGGKRLPLELLTLLLTLLLAVLLTQLLILLLTGAVDALVAANILSNA